MSTDNSSRTQTKFAPTAGDLSLHDMLRIMDEARSLRTERELVDRELNHEAVVAALRERLLESTKHSGESATPEEVDAAIRIYFENLHEFEEPKGSFSVLLAHLYVRRGLVLGLLVVAMLGAGLLWATVFRSRAPLLARQIEQVDARIAAIARVDIPRNVQLDALTRQEDDEGLRKLLTERSSLLTKLESAYEIRIPSGSNEQSGVDRYFTDETGTRVSGFYLIVNAQTADGRPVRVPIRDIETGKTAQVDRWAERVPEAVYNRIRDDKSADAILDENLFAVKRQGELDWRITLAGPDGQPVERMGQILQW